MSYTSSPFAAKARYLAAQLVVKKGMKRSQAARMYGVHRATIGKWVKRFPKGRHNFHNDYFISTLPSIPKHHPNQTPRKIVEEIVSLRKNLGRCAPVIRAHLILKGYKVSVRTVGRILKKEGLTRRKRQARFFKSLYPRPKASAPGSLVEMDTIHFVRVDGSRFYIFSLIDVYSRLGYAEYHTSLRQATSSKVIENAQRYFGFNFSMVQTDHGPEFRGYLTNILGNKDIKLRHSRVRKPNDNAHIERFNRTIQEECFRGISFKEETIKEDFKRYLDYYNNFRLHLALDLKTPTQFVAKVLS
jgi:transposase InsO family protein